ncbi:MAG: hypothetical protein ACR2KM_00835, partial [Gemmatimonadaceae bacterium]
TAFKTLLDVVNEIGGRIGDGIGNAVLAVIEKAKEFSRWLGDNRLQVELVLSAFVEVAGQLTGIIGSVFGFGTELGRTTTEAGSLALSLHNVALNIAEIRDGLSRAGASMSSLSAAASGLGQIQRQIAIAAAEGVVGNSGAAIDALRKIPAIVSATSHETDKFNKLANAGANHVADVEANWKKAQVAATAAAAAQKLATANGTPADTTTGTAAAKARALAEESAKDAAKDAAKAATEAAKEREAQISTIVRLVNEIAKRTSPLPATATAAYNSVGQALSILNGLGSELTRNRGESFEGFGKRVEDIKKLRDALGTLGNVKITLPVLPNFDYLAKGLSDQVDAVMKASLASVGKEFAATSVLDPLRKAVAEAAAIRTRISIENAVRPAGKQIDLASSPAYQAATKGAAAVGVALKHSLEAAIPPGDTLTKLLAEIDNLLNGVARKDIAKPFQGIVTALTKASNLLHGLADLAGASGNEHLSALLNTGANAATNIGAAAAEGFANPVADVSAIASSVAFLKQAFGGVNEAELARREVLHANTLALQQVAVKLSGFTVNAGNTVGAANALSALFQNKGALGGVSANQSGTAPTLGKFGILGGALGLFGLTRKTGDLQSQLNALNPVLAQFGLTFDQLTAIAKNYGVTLTDKSGRLVVGALDQLRTGFLDAAKAAFAFSSSFSDQNTLAELRDKIAGKTTPADDLARNVALIQSIGKNLIGSSKFDTTTKVGQDALRANLAGLVEGLANKSIDPSAFGGFSNLSELTGVVGSVIDALNGMQTSVSAVTQSMQNVAPYFKVDAARYNATLPNTLTSGGAGFGGELSALRSAIIPNVPATLTFSGDININGTNKEPQQIATEVLNEFQRRSLAASGTTTKWSQIQS